ncbi:MAG: hypothetical protein R3F49_08275 [Planctomycetota bacterium]
MIVPRSRSGRVAARLGLPMFLLVLAAGVMLWTQRGGAPAAPEPLALGRVLDVLGDEVPALEFGAGPPAEFCAGEARHVDELLAARAGQMIPTVIDVSTLDPIARETLQSRLVEAALDDGGPIAIDVSGATVRALEGPLDGAVRVTVGADGVLVSRAPLATPAK